jgi:hypothetical protein
MNPKTKILIGVLITVVVVASGWWVWENIWGSKTIDMPLPVCGPERVEAIYYYSPLYCNKSCNIDDDCVYTCGCGAINKNETCHDEGIMYGCIDHEVRCEKGECLLGEERLSSEVTITTDKQEYEQGEEVKVTIINGLEYPIVLQPILPDKLKSIKFLGENYGIGLIEKFDKETWVGIEPVWRCENSCFAECKYKHSFEPGEKRVFEWNQKILICDKIDRTEKVKDAEAGRYRISSAVWLDEEQNYKMIYSNEFTIR